MLVVVGAPRTRTLRVLWMLEELGLPYDYRLAPPQSDEIRAVNPRGKVPAVLVDGTMLTDSTAILTWLADANGRLTHPAGSLERARQDGITQFLLDEIEAPLWAAARHTFVLPEERRLPALKDTLRWEFEQAVRHLDSLLSGPFLMDWMTVADIIAAHLAIWARQAKFPVSDRMRSYSEGMMARPAFQRAAAL